MYLIRLRYVDWEPLHMRFRVRPNSAEYVSKIDALMKKWNSHRNAKQHICACHFKSLLVKEGKESGTVDVWEESMCEVCLHSLLDFFERECSIVKSIEIGYAEEESQGASSSNTDECVLVHDKRVEFEDGHFENVSQFAICRFPVSRQQFDEFERRTGYKATSAGNETCAKKSENNLIMQGQIESASQPMNCISYCDAIAYCTWRLARMPTEAEWLAASIVDERIYDRHRDRHLLRDSTGRLIAAAHKDALQSLGREWTSSEHGLDSAIVRSGPQYVRTQSWRSDANREIIRKDVFDVTLGFRVIIL